jgi:hypothetical protein
MNLKNWGMTGKLIFVAALLLIGFLFLIHGLGFAYLSFLFSVGPVAYLVYRLKKLSYGGKILISCLDIVAYILVPAMIFVSIIPNIIFFPSFLEKGYIPNAVIYSHPDVKSDSNPRAESISKYLDDKPFIKRYSSKLPNILLSPAFLKNGKVSSIDIYSSYLTDKPFFQTLLLEFPEYISSPAFSNLQREYLQVVQSYLLEELPIALFPPPFLERERKLELEAEVKRSLETEVKAELETRLEPELETELERRLEAEVKRKLEPELKRKLEAENIEYIESLELLFDNLNYKPNGPLIQRVLLKFPDILLSLDFMRLVIELEREREYIQSVEIYSNYFLDKPFLQGFLLKFPVTSMIGIPFSSYNTYSYFVFVFNLIFPFVGICILILFLVKKILFVLKKR